MDKFTKGQAVIVHHQDGRGFWFDHDGTIIEKVSDTVWRVQLMGINVLWPEQYIRARENADAVQPSDAQIQAQEAP